MVPIWNKLKFQAKVLIPVATVLVLVLCTTLWLVNRRMHQQQETGTEQVLTTTEAAFQSSLRFHTNILQQQFKLITTTPVFTAVANTQDRATMLTGLKEDIRPSMGDSVTVALFTKTNLEQLAQISLAGSAINLNQFSARCAESVQRAIKTREINVDTIEHGGLLYDVITIPSFDNTHEHFYGVLTLGVAMSDAIINEFKLMADHPHSELVLISNGRVIASSFRDPPSNEELLQIYKQAPAVTKDQRPTARYFEKQIKGEHFLALTGQLPSLNKQSAGSYVLLVSYQELLAQFEATRRMLVLVGLFGIILSTLVVWLLIRRATQPLIQLRDSAEAVGRGDFSHRIKIQSEDELGELAEVFNHMTENLQTSTTQLEQTVETLRTTQARLMQSEKLSAIGEFVAGVAHELNNPLTALIGFSELLQMRVSDEATKTSLKRISSSAERCHKIVQSLLSFARQHPPERKLTEVNALIDAVLEILIYELRTSNIKVEKDYAQNLPKLMVDPHQIQQVFLNIVHNARQAIEAYQPHGNIRITTRALNGKVQVRFQDDGPGISPENLKKIFDPFFTTKAVGKGTGLGLSLSYGIIHEHGGTIAAESKPGAGTAFIIEFPVASGENTTSITPEKPSPALTQEGKGRKILVVDDEEDILDLVRQTMVAQGYIVQTVTDGEKALQVLEKETFDLIVTDWKMPGLSGQQLYERLRQANPAAARQVIFMTGDVLSEKTQEYLREQNRLCLAKPFSLVDFRRAINQVLEKQ